ncbi:MAG: hypothetical protein CYPHOPRED_002583 [Cyphobasidiales sp. Tagirdzhanova-0007]|nr:MAG: hypothetical protein CYPHOPRED_002583 [Cyphobasidiales sp. Tagirdzhanova-0007]
MDAETNGGSEEGGGSEAENANKDQDIPFALYVAPRRHGFTILTEKWAVYQLARFLNWYQTLQASRREFGLFAGLWAKVSRGRREAVIEQDLLPLYKQINEVQATGESAANDRLSLSLRETISEAFKSQAHKGIKLDWRWHKLNRHSVESIRIVEFQPGENVMQMVVRFDSQQTLEKRDQSGRLLPSSGSHSRPQKVVENFVFQRRVHEGPTAQWTAIKAIPTLTPFQAIGSQEQRIYELMKRKKKPALTVV